MPQTIKLKRSATPSQTPTTGQLDLGEIAINTNDGKMFLRKSDGATDVILEINGALTGESSKVSSHTAAPTNPAPEEGDLWFDTTNDKLNYYDGAAWQEVGTNNSAIITDALTANANTTLGDNVADTLTVNATSDFNAAVNIDGNLTTTANTTVGNANTDILTVNATSTFTAAVDMDDTLNVDGAATFTNTITANGAADFNDAVNIDGNLTTTANTTIGDAAADALTVNATSTFQAPVDMNNTLNVDGAATLTNDLTVTGTTSLNGTVNLGDGADVINVNGTNIFEWTQDVVGAMVGGNTESGITVTYQDADGTLDFNVNDPTITLTGAVTGNATMTNLGNVTIATTHTADPTITLTGAVTGTGTMTNLGNVSITTTATNDPTLTLAGDLSGNATFTNLGNATLTATINANSVTLGTDTTGDYVRRLTAGNGISVSATSGEGHNPTVAMTGSYTGNFSATGNITASSDARLKENIVTIDNALEKVTQMRGVYFDKDDAHHVGVIAQEVEKVLPEVVIDDEDGYKSVAYGNIVGVLIEAIKELKEEINTLKGA